MAIIGEVEVRIIEGNCLDSCKPRREVRTKERKKENWKVAGWGWCRKCSRLPVPAPLSLAVS